MSTIATVADAEQQIRERHDKITQARLKNDVTDLNQMWPDDLIVIAPDGQMLTKTEVLRWYEEFVHFDVLEDSDPSVRIYGDTALLMYTTKMVGRAFGRPINHRVRDTIVYVKRGGKWEGVLHQMTAIAPVSSGAAPPKS